MIIDFLDEPPLMIMEMQNEITIMRNYTFMKAGHALFHWLHKLKSSTIFVLSGGEVPLIEIAKKQHEIIILDFDYDTIERKFYEWRFSKKIIWNLTKEEYYLFLKCCLSAHFYLSQQKYNIGVNRNYINELYEVAFAKVKYYNN